MIINNVINIYYHNHMLLHDKHLKSRMMENNNGYLGDLSLDKWFHHCHHLCCVWHVGNEDIKEETGDRRFVISNSAVIYELCFALF